MRVVRHRNRFPREAGDTPSVEVFKAKMDGALSNQIDLTHLDDVRSHLD